MQITNILWLEEITDKLAWKHNVTATEVEEVFWNKPRFRFMTKGRRTRDENVYAAYGQTDAGRYLIVFFIYKDDTTALVVSARTMDAKERKQYGRK